VELYIDREEEVSGRIIICICRRRGALRPFGSLCDVGEIERDTFQLSLKFLTFMSNTNGERRESFSHLVEYNEGKKGRYGSYDRSIVNSN